jgi:transposase
MINTTHFADMLKEREIQSEWVERTVSEADYLEDHPDGTRHFIKQIPEFGNRWLRVIVNIMEKPEKCVTVFFDRRLRRQHENQG